ncbi:hypothetical protein SAMN05421820_101451 [Pedobacter steynii]|uniref:Uncharacterized protein n=1 Tax=Pedobacter steynii TaxID=430522 RepID=A0A1G9K2Y3_9SPHI|nr:hypothetical protein SAMN05421820_101451 [Pedobacter steynii]
MVAGSIQTRYITNYKPFLMSFVTSSLIKNAAQLYFILPFLGWPNKFFFIKYLSATSRFIIKWGCNTSP